MGRLAPEKNPRSSLTGYIPFRRSILHPFFLFLSFFLSSFLPSCLPSFFFILLFICFFLFFFPSLFSCSSFPPSFLPALLSFLSRCFHHFLLPFFFRTQFILGSFLSSSMLSFPLDFRSAPAFLVFLCGQSSGRAKPQAPGPVSPASLLGLGVDLLRPSALITRLLTRRSVRLPVAGGQASAVAIRGKEKLARGHLPAGSDGSLKRPVPGLRYLRFHCPQEASSSRSVFGEVAPSLS